MSLVRGKAKEWGIPENASALSASRRAGTRHRDGDQLRKANVQAVDDVDKISCRPDFAIAVYPGYLKAKDKDELSPGLQIPDGNAAGFPGAWR